MVVDKNKNPFYTAGSKYHKTHQYAQQLANAAHHHPEIPFETVQTSQLDLLEDQTELTEKEAYIDMTLYSRLLSDAWSDTIEYFMHDFETEVNEFIREEKYSDPRQMAIHYEKIIESYTELEKDLQTLDSALQRKLENPPSDEPDEFAPLRPPHKNVSVADRKI